MANFVFAPPPVPPAITTVTISPNPIINTGDASCNAYIISNNASLYFEYEWYKNFYLLTSGSRNAATNISVVISSINNSSYVYDDLLLCQIRTSSDGGSTFSSWYPSNVVVVKTSPFPLVTYSIPALLTIFWNQWAWLFIGIFCLGLAYIIFQPQLHTTMLAAGILTFAAFAITLTLGQTEMSFIYLAIVYFAVGLLLRFAGSK
jgi:hypothetical protein